MSTKLGKTVSNYGQKYGIVSTHLSGQEILGANDLVPNSLIVSSPLLDSASINGQQDLIDFQTAHSLFFTDYEGNAARLTYTIIPGNGLVVNAYNWDWTSFDRPYTVDTLTLEIDHDSLKTTSDKGQLYVSKPDIIDNYTLMVHQEFGTPHTYIGVITANLEKATDVKYGITRGDNYTISANDGILNVNTENLQYADDTLNHNGIVRCNPDTPENAYIRTVEAIDGVLKVITANLDRASADTVGVVKPDFTTTSTDENGVISVLTSGLDYATNSSYGIVKPDNLTVQIKKDENDNDIPGVLFANAQNMTPTSIVDGESYFGVVKLDPVSFGIDTANFTYVNRYPEIVALLNRYLKDYDYIISWLIDHENRITALENQAAAEYIYSFNNYGTNITTLDMPTWDEEARIVHSEEKFYSVQFSINTNCKFHISVRYENNVSKPITLHSVRLGDNSVINASGLSQHVFESTNRNESTLNFTFLCDNYSSSGPEGKTPTTVILRVSSINDASIYKEGQHIFDRWNMTKFVQPAPPEPITNKIERSSYTYSTGRKKLQFIKSSNDSNTTFIASNSVKYVNNVNQGVKSNVTFYYIATQEVICKETIIKETYHDGVLFSSDETEGTTYSYTSYLSVPLASEIGRLTTPYYLNIDNIAKFTRDISINEGNTTSADGNGWANSTMQDWISLSTTAIASNTGRTLTSSKDTSNSTNSADSNKNSIAFSTAETAAGNTSENNPTTNITGGYNILNVITTTAASTVDRRAVITLKVKDAGSDWENSSLTIDYIDDVVINDCNINVEAMCRNNADTPLKIHVTKTPGSNPIGNTWKLNIKYCLKTTNGEAVKNSGNSEEKINIDNAVFSELVSQNSSSSRESQSSNSNSEVTSQLLKNFDNIVIEASKAYDEFTLNVTKTKIYATDNKGNDINNNDITISPATILPDSVFNILGTSSTTSTASSGNSGRTQGNVSNIYSGFQIMSVETISFATNNSQETSSVRTSGINISWSSNGSWPTNYVSTTQMTFGNASITNINILPWDDTRMRIEFMIRPGSTTSIPVGSTILVQTSIAPDCVLYNNNSSFKYTKYYANLILSNDGWTATGVKMTMTLNNTIPVVPDPNLTTTQLYAATATTQSTPMMQSIGNATEYNSIVSSTSAQVYVNDRGGQSNVPIATSSPLVTDNTGTKGTTGTDGLSVSAHNVLNSTSAMLQSITGLKFNFVLQAKNSQGNTTTMNFAASTSATTSKVNMTANYSNGGNKTLNPPIVNAYYNNSGSTVSIISASESEKTSSVEQLAEEIETLKETISSLTSQTTSSTNQQAEYQPNGGLKPTGVSALVGGKAGTDVQAMY